MKECVNYSELSKKYQKGIDYNIEMRTVSSDIIVAAPHGGLIEPLTTEVARVVAKDVFNFYSLTALIEDSNMHITSHQFDEPRCISIIKKCNTVVTIHGCADTDKVVYVGGLDMAKRIKIACNLRTIKGVKVVSTGHRFKGEHPDNICNKGVKKKGVQIELSAKVREDKKKLLLISDILHYTLLSYNSC